MKTAITTNTKMIMNRKIAWFLLLALIIIIIMLIQTEPLELKLSLEPCIGSTVCLAGETLELNIRIEPQETAYIGKIKTVLIESDAFEEPKLESIAIGEDKRFSIPIKTLIREGKHSIRVSSAPEDFNSILLKIRHLLPLTDYTASKSMRVKYPLVKIEDEGFTCKENGVFIKELKLKLEEEIIDELNCKIRIYTDKLTSTNHASLREHPYNYDWHYYETGYSKINKYDLSGSIQNIEFIAGPAVAQTNTEIAPVCRIDNRNVQIETQRRALRSCSVNQ